MREIVDGRTVRGATDETSCQTAHGYRGLRTVRKLLVPVEFPGRGDVHK